MKKAAAFRLRLICYINSLQNRHPFRFNALGRLQLNEIYTNCLMAEIIFKGIAARWSLKDFCSKAIENSDVFDVFSLDSSYTVGRIRINRINIVFGFCNRSWFSFNKLIETVQPYWVVPIRVLVSFGASVRNGKYLGAKLFKHNAAPSRFIAKLGRCGGQRNSSRNIGTLSERIVTDESNGLANSQRSIKT